MAALFIWVQRVISQNFATFVSVRQNDQNENRGISFIFALICKQLNRSVLDQFHRFSNITSEIFHFLIVAQKLKQLGSGGRFELFKCAASSQFKSLLQITHVHLIAFSFHFVEPLEIVVDHQNRWTEAKQERLVKCLGDECMRFVNRLFGILGGVAVKIPEDGALWPESTLTFCK
jgi:hypothetical protein